MVSLSDRLARGIASQKIGHFPTRKRETANGTCALMSRHLVTYIFPYKRHPVLRQNSGKWFIPAALCLLTPLGLVALLIDGERVHHWLPLVQVFIQL